jgi:hypothetical protein
MRAPVAIIVKTPFHSIFEPSAFSSVFVAAKLDELKVTLSVVLSINPPAVPLTTARVPMSATIPSRRAPVDFSFITQIYRSIGLKASRRS